MSDKLKLVTSKFSPYGHKVEMVLIEKNIPYEKVNVNLADRPEWFVKDAPMGKVPLLYVGNKILFESTVICEYLEETSNQNPLHLKDVTEKALHRAWIEFATTIFSAAFAMILAANEQDLLTKKTEVIAKLTILEKNLKAAPYFSGENFCLVDAVMASMLNPLVFADQKFSLKILEAFPKVNSYATKILARESFKKALPADYADLFKSFLERRKSHLATV